MPLFSSVRIEGLPVTFSETEKGKILAEIPNILKRYEELQSVWRPWSSAPMCALVLAILDPKRVQKAA